MLLCENNTFKENKTGKKNGLLKLAGEYGEKNKVFCVF